MEDSTCIRDRLICSHYCVIVDLWIRKNDHRAAGSAKSCLTEPYWPRQIRKALSILEEVEYALVGTLRLLVPRSCRPFCLDEGNTGFVNYRTLSTVLTSANPLERTKSICSAYRLLSAQSRQKSNYNISVELRLFRKAAQTECSISRLRLQKTQPMRRLPKLKRITINSELELEVWLSKNADKEESVLMVTHADVSHRKYVSREQIATSLKKHGWKSGSGYTIGSSKLLAGVISKSVSQ